jgi:TetR/AcrR family transcriptional regulator, regulator of biofilm formation and stress response
VAYLAAPERRRQAVSAARDILERDGLAAVTLRRVAERAGMTLSSLQWSVGTKDDLLRELFATINAEIAEIVRTATAGTDGVGPVMRATLTALWSAMETAPMMEVGENELVIASLREPVSRRQVAALYDAYVAVCAEALENAAQRSGERLRVPVEQLARLMVMALEGLVLLYLAGGAAERCRDDLDVLADALGALALGV